ncbi:hypothetical protein M8C21_002936, partial [Ambrosia artemisiifolia]
MSLHLVLMMIPQLSRKEKGNKESTWMIFSFNELYAATNNLIMTTSLVKVGLAVFSGVSYGMGLRFEDMLIVHRQGGRYDLVIVFRFRHQPPLVVVSCYCIPILDTPSLAAEGTTVVKRNILRQKLAADALT